MFFFFFLNKMYILKICLFFELFLLFYALLFTPNSHSSEQTSQRNTQSTYLFSSASSKAIDLALVAVAVCLSRGKNKSFKKSSCLSVQCVRCTLHRIGVQFYEKKPIINCNQQFNIEYRLCI